jgi:hypothetical protein
MPPSAHFTPHESIGPQLRKWQSYLFSVRRYNDHPVLWHHHILLYLFHVQHPLNASESVKDDLWFDSTANADGLPCRFSFLCIITGRDNSTNWRPQSTLYQVSNTSSSEQPLCFSYCGIFYNTIVADTLANLTQADRQSAESPYSSLWSMDCVYGIRLCSIFYTHRPRSHPAGWLVSWVEFCTVEFGIWAYFSVRSSPFWRFIPTLFVCFLSFHFFFTSLYEKLCGLVYYRVLARASFQVALNHSRQKKNIQSCTDTAVRFF